MEKVLVTTDLSVSSIARLHLVYVSHKSTFADVCQEMTGCLCDTISQKIVSLCEVSGNQQLHAFISC